MLTVILSVTGSINPLSSGIFRVCELLYQIDRMKRGSEQLSAHAAAQCAGITGRKEYITVLSGRKVALIEQHLPHCAVRHLSVQIFILASSHCRFSTFRHKHLCCTQLMLRAGRSQSPLAPVPPSFISGAPSKPNTPLLAAFPFTLIHQASIQTTL